MQSTLTPPPHLEPPPKTLSGAMARVATVSQDVVADRLDLLRLDVEAKLAQVAERSVFLVTGALLVLMGWIALMIGSAVLLSYALPVPAAIGLIALPHLGGGAALVVHGMSAEESEPEESDGSEGVASL